MKTLHILLLAAAFSILAFNATHGEEIINGRKARKNSLQYMVSLQENGTHKCGGFLINPSYVLTAAHCYKSNRKFSVVLGTQNIDPQRKLRKYVVEREYKPSEYKRIIFGSDIMLLKLSKKVRMIKGVKTIQFSKSKSVNTKSKCQVAGWGRTETQKMTNDLLVTDVSIINITVCKKEYTNLNQNLPPNVLCAGGYGTKSGACQGDSGGPLVCNGKAVGIVSFNYNGNCSYPNVPNVYTEISAYADWIKKVLNGDA